MSERVLLVDDDEDTLTSLQDLLQLEGVDDVRRARTLADADHILADGFRPTAVVLDLLLNGDRGEPFIGRLAADPALASVPVIAVSGDPRALAAVDRSVARAFLKPADPLELVNALRRVAGCERDPAGRTPRLAKTEGDREPRPAV